MQQQFYTVDGQEICLNAIDPRSIPSQSLPSHPLPTPSNPPTLNKQQLIQQVQLTESLHRVNRILLSSKKQIQLCSKPFNHNKIFQYNLDSNLECQPIHKMVVIGGGGEEMPIRYTQQQVEMVAAWEAREEAVVESGDREEGLGEREIQDIFDDVPALDIEVGGVLSLAKEGEIEIDEKMSTQKPFEWAGKAIKRTRREAEYYQECYHQTGPNLEDLQQQGIKQSQTMPIQPPKRKKRVKKEDLSTQLKKVQNLMKG